MSDAYQRLRRKRSAGASLRRDLFAAAVGAVVGESIADEAAAPVARMLWGALGAIASILIVETVWFVVRYVWVTPAQMHAEDHAQIAKLDRELQAARDPKGLRVQFREDDEIIRTVDGVCSAVLTNWGVSDDFSLKVGYSTPGGYSYAESFFRWKGSTKQRHQIVNGRDGQVEFLRVEHRKDDTGSRDDRFSVTRVLLLSPDGEKDVAVEWISEGRTMRPLQMQFTLLGSLSGASEDYYLTLYVATDGRAKPQVHLVIRRG